VGINKTPARARVSAEVRKVRFTTSQRAQIVEYVLGLVKTHDFERYPLDEVVSDMIDDLDCVLWDDRSALTSLVKATLELLDVEYVA
jgi:hypothetical protein